MCSILRMLFTILICCFLYLLFAIIFHICFQLLPRLFYGKNYQLFFFSKFNVYLYNLRRHHNRFQTLRRFYWGIFNFLTLKIWEIDLLGICYISANFQTCSICRTTKLEIPIPIIYFFIFYFILLYFPLVL